MKNTLRFSLLHYFKMSKRKSSDKPTSQANAKKVKTGGHWSLGLLAAIDDPALFVKSDDLVNVIKDKFPKAKHHYLILPKENISSLKSVTPQHTCLLKHMEEIGRGIARENPESDFKLGYHAEASMARLHLHVISEDMNSDCVKTKKHWNSFTTGFFINSEDIRKNLETNGTIKLPSREECKKYMDTPLRCHRCELHLKNMPLLKKHILTCDK